MKLGGVQKSLNSLANCSSLLKPCFKELMAKNLFHFTFAAYLKLDNCRIIFVREKQLKN